MLFNSLEFIVFFPIVLIVYYALPARARRYWLLVSSYYFYMSWNPKYAVLILFSTLVTYISGLLIDAVNNKEKNFASKKTLKKLIVTVSVLLNIGVLGYFKYTDFLIDSINSFFAAFHVEFTIRNFDILLPVGISFYTFQALSYTIDVYRNETKAEKSFVKYALFVSFFPQLVAGPIERSKNLLGQLTLDNKFNAEAARDGFVIMLWGYFQKMVIADGIAIMVDSIFDKYETSGGAAIVLATVLFGFQIYCDFGGYSSIAIGASKILGIKLMENFDAPYMAESVAEFWRRWHISLTTWFKDYLYIPLGGSRRGKARKYLNKMIVFVVSGLWHGAAFHFVFWGFLNGAYQVLGEIVAPLVTEIEKRLNLTNHRFIKILKIILTFILVDFAWLFFRAESVSKAFFMIKQIFVNLNLPSFKGLILFPEIGRKNAIVLVLGLFILLLCDICKTKRIVVRMWLYKQNDWIRVIMVSGIILAILIFGHYGSTLDASQFVYFQF